jgi:hypothetical protein
MKDRKEEMPRKGAEVEGRKTGSMDGTDSIENGREGDGD